ncbi:hypothetical protein FSS13T_15560 [Flavobacterium saliperosum S13]|uniref:Uncharacterized membrane protein YgdD, TMEM256/DUF423 family n=2 Tax=Flavobacterium saliperosum TaxID=329186 RepID=A0A1G4VGF8_9FLAO|nr:DUF423 domain-containing protein [Flavobacterium saliperosum]ESU25765.1 hypothetical protein FSS13T_15560 [Flavobacterium saliperosum S13]SCX06395.1 Uncharacterized membrane protein YgdD, TMEM256/DUF423 family [Flavobacterium saliperosum]
MKETILAFGALYGGLAVIFGAFGAHALKKKMSEDLLKSFETGVKYQMYHALVLLILPQLITFQSGLEKTIGWCFIIGVFLFSFSIYGLCLTSMSGNKWRFLGPITPLGGLLLVAGWLVLLFSVI